MTTRMNRFGFASIVLTMVVITGSYALADSGEASSVHGSFDKAECRYARWDGRHGVTDTEAHKMVRCAEARWPVPGGMDKLSSLIACESGWKEQALNQATSAGGLFQFVASTWDGLRSRSRALGRRFDLSWSRFNARASAVLGTRLIHQSGYGPWSSGACA